MRPISSGWAFGPKTTFGDRFLPLSRLDRPAQVSKLFAADERAADDELLEIPGRRIFDDAHLKCKKVVSASPSGAVKLMSRLASARSVQYVLAMNRANCSSGALTAVAAPANERGGR